MLDRKLNLGFVFIIGFFVTVLTIAGCSDESTRAYLSVLDQ